MSKQKELEHTIITLLNASDDKSILEGLKKSKTHGNSKILPFIIDLVLHSPEGEVLKKSTELLNTLNDQESIHFILQAAKNEASKGKRHLLMSALWQSSLQCQLFIDQVVEIAIKNDYITFIECMSIAENLSAPLDDELMEKSIQRIQEAIQMKEHPNQELLVEMGAILKQTLIG